MNSVIYTITEIIGYITSFITLFGIPAAFVLWFLISLGRLIFTPKDDRLTRGELRTHMKISAIVAVILIAAIFMVPEFYLLALVICIPLTLFISFTYLVNQAVTYIKGDEETRRYIKDEIPLCAAVFAVSLIITVSGLMFMTAISMYM